MIELGPERKLVTMKSPLRRFALPGVVAAAMFAALLSPAPASASDVPPPPSKGSTVTVEPKLKGTTIDKASLPPESVVTSSQLLDGLRLRGLAGSIVTAQKGASGGTFYSDGTSWVLDLAPASALNQMSASAVSPQFSYGFCTGYFNKPSHVASYLQWGAQSSCTASNGQYYLHQGNGKALRHLHRPVLCDSHLPSNCDISSGVKLQ